MLFLENPCLAGYRLTGNWSMQLKTDGSLTWLCRYPLCHSPLHTMNQCHGRLPILYQGQLQFVDPIKRQTQPEANLLNCTDQIQNLFQFDLDHEYKWYKVTSDIVLQKRHAVYRAKDVSAVTTCLRRHNSLLSLIPRGRNVHWKQTQ